MLVAQQSLFDETRAPRGQHTLWAYAHVPFNSKIDISERIESQIERFAPGFRNCILARHKMGVADLQYQGNVFLEEWNGCPDAALKKLGVKYS